MFGDTSDDVDEVNCPRFLCVCNEITIITKNNKIMKKQSFTILLVLLISMISTKALAYDIAVKNADGVTIYY